MNELAGTKDLPKELLPAIAKFFNGNDAKNLAAADVAKWSASNAWEVREGVFGLLLKKKDDPAAVAAFDAAWKASSSAESLLKSIEKVKTPEFAEKVRGFIHDKNGGVATSAMKAAGALNDTAALDILFEAAEKNEHVQDAITSIDKIKTDKLDAAQLTVLAERAAKLAEASSGKGEISGTRMRWPANSPAINASQLTPPKR